MGDLKAVLERIERIGGTTTPEVRALVAVARAAHGLHDAETAAIPLDAFVDGIAKAKTRLRAALSRLAQTGDDCG